MSSPEATGRSAVIGPGQAAPAGWESCERVVVDEVCPDVARTLHRLWRERAARVFELSPGIGLDDPARPPADRIEGRQPWEWPVDLILAGEWAHHGLWANSVDARGGGRPRWRWAEEAVAAGARPDAPPSTSTAGPPASRPAGPSGSRPAGPSGARPASPGIAGGTPDAWLADGTPVLCDGGPLDAGLADRVGMAVLHRVSIEHRSLAPLGRPAAGAALAPDQAAAVQEPLAGARIIAPAGSGKTRVLTERARSLLVDWRLPPAAVALVAYNVRAAGEMRERLADRPELRIRTLNALGLRLCGRATTIDEPEVRRILGDLVVFPKRAETDPVAPWIEALSRVRLGLVPPGEAEAELGDVVDLDPVARRYRAELAGRDAVDFDEQITAAIERLLTDPAFRARSQRHARVLLVDEFQDLTPAHMLLLRLLCGPAGAVFGVGDDDQTIYGYAGATPQWLVDFDRWFPGSASHPLEVNYRCPTGVVAAAGHLLTRNGQRVPKTIRPAPGAAEGGLEVVLGGTAVVDATAGRVQALLEAGARPSDIAVLSRVNAALVPVQVVLAHRGVPVDGTGDRRFLQRGGVRAALAWLELASAPARGRPGAAIREAARRPKRGMSHSLLDLLARARSLDSLDGLAVWLEEKGSSRDATKVDAFAADVALVREAAGRGTAAVLQAVRRRVGGGGLDASASALDQWTHGAIAAHADDLDALSELASLEPDPARFGAWLADQLARPSHPDGVTLASVHAVKGREWPHVVVHQATDGIIPHRLSSDDEEERRIFHVGLTRGSASVSVVAGQPPSPFLTELDQPGRPPAPTAAGSPGRRSAASAGGSAPTAGRAGGVPDRRAGKGSSRAGAGGSRAGDQGGPEELAPAIAGLVFSVGGHDHTVEDGSGPSGARCVVGAGPARTVVEYGRTVTVGGRPAVLAHPSAPGAWERLRAWRAERARSAGVPAYVVCDDRALRLIAATLPLTEAGLLAVRGIGPPKFESYGSDLLGLAEELRSEPGGAPAG